MHVKYYSSIKTSKLEISKSNCFQIVILNANSFATINPKFTRLTSVDMAFPLMMMMTTTTTAPPPTTTMIMLMMWFMATTTPFDSNSLEWMRMSIPSTQLQCYCCHCNQGLSNVVSVYALSNPTALASATSSSSSTNIIIIWSFQSRMSTTLMRFLQFLPHFHPRTVRHTQSFLDFIHSLEKKKIQQNFKALQIKTPVWGRWG